MAKLVEIPAKGIKFESPYNDLDIGLAFRALIEKGDLDNNAFAQSLYNGAKKYRHYTAGQVPWLHVLVAQAEGRPTKPAPDVQLEGLEQIHAHLVNCRESHENGGKGLLYPMVRLLVDGQEIALKVAGSRSQNAGKVSVSSDHRYGQGVFYGWIDDLGNFESRNIIPSIVIDTLKRVAVDPVRVISEIGKESGRCCYCFSELTTVASKMAGCGKTCASNYSIPYPRAAEIRSFVLDRPEILEGASDADKWMIPAHV